MALDATLVRAGVTGAAYVAPTGTVLPTDGSTALAAGFQDVGYLHEDGLSEEMSIDTEDIKAWQNGDIVRKIQTGHDVTYSFTFIETNDVTQLEYYGNYTTNTVEIRGEELPHRAWVLSVIDGDWVRRIVIPDGQITDRGEVTYQNGDIEGRQVTITCYPDTSGVKAYHYIVAPV